MDQPCVVEVVRDGVLVRRRATYPPVAFQVEGTGEFPHDMLRYDCCRAASPKDQELIDLTYRVGR